MKKGGGRDQGQENKKMEQDWSVFPTINDFPGDIETKQV